MLVIPNHEDGRVAQKAPQLMEKALLQDHLLGVSEELRERRWPELRIFS